MTDSKLNDDENLPVMYIFVNNDLDMSKGQIVAQCCHMAHLITDERVTALYEEHPPTAETLAYMRWRKSCVKIIKRATVSQLQVLSRLPYARQFIDEGMRIPGGTLTVVGFLPRSPAHIHQDIDVKQYRLL